MNGFYCKYLFEQPVYLVFAVEGWHHEEIGGISFVRFSTMAEIV